ncbi:MAG: hypothetical protein DRH03_10425 [Deltaproteobacteria bacterium]|nr:MAG: hypothetical protein DRH03_10425 [Deltaproteobacteria bacterium]
MPTDINTTETKLHRLLQSAVPKQPEPTRINKILLTLIIICLLGTMLPFQSAVVFFSMGTATIAVLVLTLLLRSQLKISKSMGALLIALMATSILSGCGPAFTFQTQQEMIKFAHENDFNVHSIRRIGVFGLGLDDATIATAQADSTIKTIQGAQIDRGYGLISVTIAGKS